MSPAARARSDQVARRINSAWRLLASGFEPDAATHELARRYRLSVRQARRYVDRALDSQGPIEIPDSKAVFTVKLSKKLAREVRLQAKKRGESISVLVGQALRAWLDRLGAGNGGPD